MTKDHTTIAAFAPPIREYGSLRVSISPTVVVSLGAQWSVDGTNWYDSGYTLQNLSVGTYSVQFKKVTGWTEPKSHEVDIKAGQTSSISDSYAQDTLVWDSGNWDETIWN